MQKLNVDLDGLFMLVLHEHQVRKHVRGVFVARVEFQQAVAVPSALVVVSHVLIKSR